MSNRQVYFQTNRWASTTSTHPETMPSHNGYIVALAQHARHPRSACALETCCTFCSHINAAAECLRARARARVTRVQCRADWQRRCGWAAGTPAPDTADPMRCVAVFSGALLWLFRGLWQPKSVRCPERTGWHASIWQERRGDDDNDGY